MDEEEYQLKSVVLFIAAGTLFFILVFIFAKRQITRFAVKSSRGPHVSIGTDAPKSLRQEIEKQLIQASEIHFEPVLLTSAKEEVLRPIADTEQCHYYYRMKAMDALSLLEDEIQMVYNTDRRLTGRNLRQSLLELQSQGLLSSGKPEVIRNFIEAYEHARHDPEIFGKDQWTNYMILLRELILCVQGSRNGSTTSRTKNPKQTKNNHQARNSSDSLTNISIPETEPMMGRGSGRQDEVQITYRPSAKHTAKSGMLRMSQLSTSGSSIASRESKDSFELSKNLSTQTAV